MTTWNELIILEPQLEMLSRLAKSVTGCPNDAWYRPGGLKFQMTQVVGRYAATNHPVLITSEAYDIAYDKLYWDDLPPCTTDCCILDEDDEDDY